MSLSNTQLEAFASFVGIPVSPKTPIELTQKRIDAVAAKDKSIARFRERFEACCNSSLLDNTQDLALDLWSAFLEGNSVILAIYESDASPAPPWYISKRRDFGVLRIDEVSGSKADGFMLRCTKMHVGIWSPGDRVGGEWIRLQAGGLELAPDQLIDFQPLFSIRESDIIDLVKNHLVG